VACAGAGDRGRGEDEPLRVLLAAGVAALVLVPASAARDALIRPGKGIGKVDLGMTLPQVKAAMGRHDTGWSEPRGLGLRYLELTWDGGPEDHFAVGLLGRPGALRVVSVITTRPGERLRGVGPGTTVAKLRRTLRGLRCRTIFPPGDGTIIQTEYYLGAPNGPQTVFVPGKWRFYGSNPSGRVAYVAVRAPGAVTGVKTRPCAR
jgi:hypothetical protein